MPKRPFTIIAANPEVRSQCEKAAACAGDAISEVTVYANLQELQAAGELEGLVVVEPSALGELSMHEWAIAFLRKHKVLLFLLSNGTAQDADGLARFVGAQGALPLPLDADELASRLSSPFGTPGGIPRPMMPEVDQATLEENLGAQLGAIFGQNETSGREGFVQSITDSETGLFTVDYWEHRLEEEYKRSNRFRFPLGLVTFRVDGLVSDDKLLDVSSIILLDTRDVDVVTRFDDQTFLALLPHTGPGGAALFAKRVHDGLNSLGLHDLVGDSVEWTTHSIVSPDSSLSGARDFLARALSEGVSQI
ncbi:MAG: hypothetical protein HQ519_00250 [Planctomycetes bacterium]|nr:hypothetical protein [Planctomycetota bacterium]